LPYEETPAIIVQARRDAEALRQQNDRASSALGASNEFIQMNSTVHSRKMHEGV
jgi:hypothetical protein